MASSIPHYAPMSVECQDSNGLAMEQAKITFNSFDEQHQSLYIYGVSDNCYQCLHLPLSHESLQSNNNTICTKIDTHHPYSIGFSTESPFLNCSNNSPCAWQPNSYVIQPFSLHYNEYHHYDISVTNDSKYILKTTKTAPDKFIPLYIALSVAICLIICYNIYRLFIKSKINSSSDDDRNIHRIDIPDNNDDNGKLKQKKKQRFVSLDAFRGMSLIIMIFVNHHGGGYWWLEHSTWNGLTIADLVFPWFVFMMGTAMAIVFPRKLAKIEKCNNALLNDNNSEIQQQNQSNLHTKSKLVKRVIIRGIKLILIGMFLNNWNNIEYCRIMGVLQYFGIAYLINGLLLIFTEPSTQTIMFYKKHKFFSYFIELFLYWKQFLFISCLLFIYLMFINYLPVTMYNEKCPNNYNGPGGIGDYGKYIQCTGGAQRYIDYKLFGDKHVYQHPTAKEYYHIVWYEAESFIGSLTCISLCYFGILIGRMLQHYTTHKQRIIKWLLYSFIFGLIAGILCNFNQNDGIIPVNKNLWSISFICCQASTGIIVLIIFYILIDVLNTWDGKPFHYLGNNSILIYVGSHFLSSYFPFTFQYRHPDHYKVLLSGIMCVTCWMLIAAYLFHKQIFYNL